MINARAALKIPLSLLGVSIIKPNNYKAYIKNNLTK
jgi:hypothetical protein